jgi:hypothetical protein
MTKLEIFTWSLNSRIIRLLETISKKKSGGKMTNKILARYFIREILGIVVMGAALFWSAGTFQWWQAWATLLVTVAWSVGIAWVILRRHPDLLADRLGPRKGAESCLWFGALPLMLSFRKL